MGTAPQAIIKMIPRIAPEVNPLETPETERSIISNGVNKVAPPFESERCCILNLIKLQSPLIPNKKGHRSFGSIFVTFYDPNDYFLQPTDLYVGCLVYQSSSHLRA